MPQADFLNRAARGPARQLAFCAILIERALQKPEINAFRWRLAQQPLLGLPGSGEVLVIPVARSAGDDVEQGEVGRGALYGFELTGKVARKPGDIPHHQWNGFLLHIVSLCVPLDFGLLVVVLQRGTSRRVIYELKFMALLAVSSGNQRRLGRCQPIPVIGGLLCGSTGPGLLTGSRGHTVSPLGTAYGCMDFRYSGGISYPSG